MRSLVIWATMCVAGCDIDDSRVDGRDGDIGDSKLFQEVVVDCDGDVSVWDYLVYMEAFTDESVIDVSVELFQRGDSFGVFELQEVRPGEWYAEEWEDELWIECEDPISATFYGLDASGRDEYIDL